jgi:hypothetical protein
MHSRRVLAVLGGGKDELRLLWLFSTVDVVGGVCCADTGGTGGQ